ncbi:WGR domain-containing protein [Novosphingobium sp. ES2-1]|uniref:WGR domain-containing protein n=1 Tax=Novosphingobium sp. ES2-1 TaxID=2780074 RepID=UPI001E4D4B0C|nr:WGR domain-containing protein [Novosphingobium sp. ES2-1]
MFHRMDNLTHGSFVWLEAVCGERNIARRYTVALSQDLFGASIVDFAWGRIGSRGQGRAVSFASEDEAARFARQLLRRRASAPKRIGVPYREVALAP